MVAENRIEQANRAASDPSGQRIVFRYGLPTARKPDQ
jgi:hypothetical protein